MYDRPVFSQQVSIIVLKGQFPKQGLFHGQLGRGGPIKW